MRLLLIFIFSLLFSVPPLSAQGNGIEQFSDLVTVGSDKFLRWYGHEGRSYFLQISDPNSHLQKWTWAPVIESGNDENISYEVDGTANKGYFRLKYTDQVPGPGETLDTADFDGDGISNIDEIAYFSTDPLNPDSDEDGLDDDFEIYYFGTDPNHPDSDADGLSDRDEVSIYWTRPNYADSDGDGLSDGEEVNLHGTDPNLADTDGDGLPDELEIAHSLDPLNAADGSGDLDSDEMPNGWEYLNGLNIALNDAAGDHDGDELTNLAEYQNGTKANQFDTDEDLLPDGWEVRYVLNPLSTAGVHGMDGDGEPDGVRNIDELIHGSSPVLTDTDGDGTGDLQEIDQGSDPNDASDGGQAPAADDIASVKLTVGDPSGSESERYKMIVKGVEGDTRTISHQAKEFGVVSTKSYKLRKGAKYEVEIVHTGTKPEFLKQNGFSNYDWKADIQPDQLGVILEPAVLVKKDPNTIFTTEIDWPNSTFRIKGKKAELFVMKFETLTEASIPSDWKRKKLGVAEPVDITVTPQNAGNIVWSLANQQDSSLLQTSSYKPRFTAASLQCNPELKADFGNGITHTLNFQVVEPTGEMAEKESDLSPADMGITAQQQGVGMNLIITLLPNDVSFENLEVRELSGPASNQTGYFLQYTGGDRYHAANPDWQRVDKNNQYGDQAGFWDWPKIMVKGNLQWIPGSYEWDIPLRWRVPGKPERNLPSRIQKHEINGNDGSSTETKLGQSATRTPSP